MSTSVLETTSMNMNLHAKMFDRELMQSPECLKHSDQE